MEARSAPRANAKPFRLSVAAASNPRSHRETMYQMARVEEIGQSMIRTHHSVIRMRTSECLQFVDLTDAVEEIVAARGHQTYWSTYRRSTQPLRSSSMKTSPFCTRI